MEQYKELLEARKQELLQIKHEKEKALKGTPEGTLRISGGKEKPLYYHRMNPKDHNGTYIKDADISVAIKLAQKDYDKKVLRAAEQEITSIDKYMQSLPKLNVEQVYENLNEERQKLILPIREKDEEFIRNWENVEYQGKGFHYNSLEYYTAKGERVRSKSEVIIADALYREGIPYRYEYPIWLSGFETVHPDFMCLNVRTRKELFWEHLGMMDDEEYAEKAIRKISTYVKNDIFPGDDLILTYETKQSPLNQKIIQKMIQKYLC